MDNSTSKIDLTFFEKQLWNKGLEYIAGVDEVGRGSLAGPMVVCAVILKREHLKDLTNLKDEHKTYAEIKDSKLLSGNKRRRISEFIISELVSYSIIEVPNYEIDASGIMPCTISAFSKSISKLDVKPHHILTDSFEIPNIAKQTQTNLVRGDNKSISIAAASIIAKVYRDNLMVDFHEKHHKYKVYRFDKHKGYGTKLHRDMIKKHGHSDLHRKSFNIS